MAGDQQRVSNGVALVEIELKQAAIEYLNAALDTEKPLSRLLLARVREKPPAIHAALPVGMLTEVALTHGLTGEMGKVSKGSLSATAVRVATLRWLTRRVAGHMETTQAGGLIVEDSLGRGGDEFVNQESDLSVCNDAVYCIIPAIDVIDMTTIQDSINRMQNAYPPLVGAVTRVTLQPAPLVTVDMIAEAVANTTMLFASAYDGEGYLIGEW